MVIGLGDRVVDPIYVERDLGTERGSILAGKARSYSSWLHDDLAMNVGFVVESPRRAAAIRHRLRGWMGEYELPGHRKVPCWVTVRGDLTDNPYGEIWRAPDGHSVSARGMDSFKPLCELPPLGPLCLLADGGPEALDDHLLAAIGQGHDRIWW